MVGNSIVKEVFSSVERPNLYESVYAQIAQALIEGRLRPDDKLRIRPLADQLGTSITPVRDAILSLVKDGALESRTPKDGRVPRIQVGQFNEIRMIRLRVEGLAARLAAQNANMSDVARLRGILEANEKARSNDDMYEAIKLNQAFHAEIARIAGLPLLRDMIQRLWLRMGPIIAELYPDGGREMIDHHHEILEAISDRDADAAEQAIREDIDSAADILLAKGMLLADEGQVVILDENV